ncbi:MAG: hypothetical protein ACE5OR_16140 [bacterium]
MNVKKHEQLIRDFVRFMDAPEFDQVGELLADDVVYVTPKGSP